MDCLVVVNARAGNGHTPEWSEALVAKFRERGISARVELADSGEKLASVVREAIDAGLKAVVAGGGDGTVNQVASAVNGSDCVLGVLPLGTLNHFAKDLGIPLDIDQAVDVIAAGHARRVDTAEVNGKLFLNNSSIGLYPDIVRERKNEQQRLGRGKWLAFGWACMAALRRYPFLQVTLRIDGKEHARRTAFVFVGNNQYVMEGFDFGARKHLDRGVISVVVSRHTGRLGLLRLALRAFFGRLHEAGDLDALLTNECTIETPHHQMLVSTDGEVARQDTPLLYRSRPLSLRVLVPTTTAAPSAQGGR